MTKIALFHPSFTTHGGAESLCANQARQLLGQGFQVVLVTYGYDAGKWATELRGVEVRTVLASHWSDGVLNWNRRTKLLAKARRARGAFEDVDLVVAHNAPCNLMLGSLELPCRTLWQCNEPSRTLHPELANPYLARRANSDLADPLDDSTRSWRAEGRSKKAARESRKRELNAAQDIELTRNLDSLYAISEYSRENARIIYGRCQDEVVYPFVRFPEGGRKVGGTAEAGLQVLVQTRLERHKNVDSVLRGFAEYRRTDPGAVLHVVGDGPVAGELRALAESLELGDSCRMHGYLSTEDLRSVYDRCDVFALLTLDEPFGMVYPEAAARGLLMVGPDHGGPFEILEGGEIGHCIDPFAPEALAEALQELRGLSAMEADRRRLAADESCRGRFGDEVIRASLLRALGLGQPTAG